MNIVHEIRGTCETHESIWQTDSAQQTVRSAIGWEVQIPAHWCVERRERTIYAAPLEEATDDETTPFEFGSHVVPRGRAGKLGGACEDRLMAGGARIIRRQTIQALRPTTLLDAVAEPADEHPGRSPMRACMIAEMIDDGALCVYHICRDWSADPEAARRHALQIWRAAARTPHPIAPERRRWIHEAARLHFQFPAAWIVDEDSPMLLVARQRRRLRSQPSLILSVETGPDHARSLVELRSRVHHGSCRWLPTRIGNRGGLRADASHINQHGELHFTRQILPEPTTNAAVWAQLSVDSRERHCLDMLQNAFAWNEK